MARALDEQVVPMQDTLEKLAHTRYFSNSL